MCLVHQTIPQEHVPAFLKRGHFFAPCNTFVDLMEFRYGYCLFNSDESPEGLTACLRKTFQDEDINRSIDSTCVSCWTSSGESFAMWEVYGRGDAAIRISVDHNDFREHVQAQVGMGISAGPVTYAGLTSLTRPQFVTEAHDRTEEQKRIDYLFFHKHGFYTWEQEFRLILFQQGPVSIPIAPTLIQRVAISPFGKLDRMQEDSLRQQFGDRVRTSNLKTLCGC